MGMSGLPDMYTLKPEGYNALDPFDLRCERVTYVIYSV